MYVCLSHIHGRSLYSRSRMDAYLQNNALGVWEPWAEATCHGTWPYGPLETRAVGFWYHAHGRYEFSTDGSPRYYAGHVYGYLPYSTEFGRRALPTHEALAEMDRLTMKLSRRVKANGLYVVALRDFVVDLANAVAKPPVFTEFAALFASARLADARRQLRQAASTRPAAPYVASMEAILTRMEELYHKHIVFTQEYTR